VIWVGTLNQGEDVSFFGCFATICGTLSFLAFGCLTHVPVEKALNALEHIGLPSNLSGYHLPHLVHVPV
jgi:hypothetical protein